jgi:hypothetical protein
MKVLGVIQLRHEVLLTGLMAGILLSAQIALFCLWRILDLIEENLFFSKTNLNWFDRIVKSLLFGLISAVLMLVTLLFQADDPGGPVLLTAITLFISTLYVLASLLRDQIESQVSS